MSKGKLFNYELSESDIKTLLTTLTVMDEVLPVVDIPELDELTKLQCSTYGKQAMEHLSNLSTQISDNEISAIHVSLQLADLINRSDISVDDYSKNLCSQNIFSINKLLPIFDSFFS